MAVGLDWTVKPTNLYLLVCRLPDGIRPYRVVILRDTMEGTGSKAMHGKEVEEATRMALDFMLNDRGSDEKDELARRLVEDWKEQGEQIVELRR